MISFYSVIKCSCRKDERCQRDSAVTIRLIKDEPGGRSTSQVKASVNIFIPEKIQ